MAKKQKSKTRSATRHSHEHFLNRELQALEGEIDSLHGQIETRKTVGRAKSILIERYGLSEREAFRRLQAQSLALNKSLKEIADAIILTEEINVVKT